ncbi:MAG: hypothetical protein WCE90_06245 [Candidatus Zixiibacteriota bacterium]
MKKPTSIFVVGLVVLFGFLIFFRILHFAGFAQEIQESKQSQSSNCQDTTVLETYVSKLIISAPYAKNSLRYGNEESPPGEFGYQAEEDIRSVSLFNAFTVTPNGDIYIVDPLNKRIQKFNQEGNFVSSIEPLDRDMENVCLSIDQNQDIFLTDCEKNFIFKYNPKGILLMTYYVFEEFACSFVCCDKFGRVFHSHPHYIGGSIFYQVGTSERPFTEKQQKKSIKNGLIGFNSVALDNNLFFRPDSLLHKTGLGSLYAFNFNEDTLHVFKSIQGEFLGCDENLNIYTQIYNSKTRTMEVKKYNEKGEYVSCFKYDCPETYYGIHDSALNCCYLDNQGNIYIFCQSLENDGIKVIKWYKQ